MPLLIFPSSCFFILFWLDVSFFLLVHTVDLSSSFLPITIGSLYIFLYFTQQAFIFSSNLRPNATISMSILITSVLNCASDRLAISLLLSCISSGALICFFIWAIFFVLVCLFRKGAEPQVFTRAGQPKSMCCDAVCGGGAEREQWCLFHSLPVFSHYPCYPQSKWALLVLISQVGGFVYILGPCGSLQ